MITARFKPSPQGFSAVVISGHSGYADEGHDIVCAAVSSAFQLCANGITEVLGEDALVIVNENQTSIALPQGTQAAAVSFLSALQLHLSLLQEQYPKNIKLTNM